MARGWGGRKVAALTALTLDTYGDVCHLCGLEGSDSPDHDPPRRDLLAAGVDDPDALEFLRPSHRLCNLRRGTRPVTDDLRRALRRRRLADLERAAALSNLSPRFFEKRPQIAPRP